MSSAKKKSASKSSPKTSSNTAPKRVTWKLKKLDDALRILMRATKSISEYIELPLAECGGRVSAQEIKSNLKLPPVDRSERDGYALRSKDCESAGVGLVQIGEATAGHPFDARIKPGTCVRIATGAVMPSGADAVAMFEDVEAGMDGAIKINQRVEKHQWVGLAGSDFKLGQRVLKSGELLTPPAIAGLGSLGVASLQVLRQPRATVFTTGDEVKKPGQELGDGDVFDGNTAGLCALLGEEGVDAKAHATVLDTLGKLTATLKRLAAKNDLIVFTGGTSVGDRDYGRLALDACGETLVHGLNLKPGKPLLAGTIGGCLVIGLPGFPTSAMMVAYTVLVPLARKLAGRPIDAPRDFAEAKLAEEVRPNPHKTFALPVRFNALGEVESAFRGSGQVSTLSLADGILMLEAGGKTLKAGTSVRVRLM